MTTTSSAEPLHSHMVDSMRLGKAIRIARAHKGWKQKDLANALGATPNYISLLEHDRRDPSWSFICRLCDALEIPLPLLILLASEGEKDPLASAGLPSVIARELLKLRAAMDPDDAE